MFLGIMFFSLVAGASYPAPFTSDTATIIGANAAPSDNIAAPSIASNLNTNTYTIVKTEIKTDKKLFSEKDICKLMKGCYNLKEQEIDLQNGNNISIDTDLYMGCLPYGYRIGNKYCGFKETVSKYTKKTRFELDLFSQSNSNEECSNSFECKSNFCFNRVCIDTIKTVDDGIVRIDKSDLEELRSIIENAEVSMEGDYNEEESKSFFSSLISLFKRMFSW